MKTRRKWWKLGVAIVAVVIAAQIGVSLLVRTRRVHAYLTARLQQAFGRPVEVRSFSVQLLPAPRFEADQVTVGEDPAFGNEYFLRADSLSASLRWSGLLRGHFEFGTLSFSRPSLILVRNAQGRWNLERWLPPAKAASLVNVYGPPSPVAPVNRLVKIEFDEGRIDFKNLDDKLAFAFTDVSGNVEQVSPGRWQLQLRAQPWRSGVMLQSAGIVSVQGDIAGTSARLQPARFTLHWGELSLADLFRLLHGRDFGVRGVVSLDGVLNSGTSADAASAQAAAGVWSFSASMRASQIHRWDLGERGDNPRLELKLNGHWNVSAGTVRADSIAVESPRSNLRGSANYVTGPSPAFDLHLDSAGVQASDLLAWYRAFTPGVDDGIAAEEYFTGAATLRGWPVRLQDAAFSSNGGIVRVPALRVPIRIGPVRGGRERGALAFGPVRVAFDGSARDVVAPKKRRIAALMQNAADVTFVHDLESHSGSISIEGQVQHAEEVLKTAAGFGRPINHGWELTGDVLAVTSWGWKDFSSPRWNGRILLNKSRVSVAGLNQLLDVQAGTLNWNDGLRSVDVTKVNGFGGSWTGTINERTSPEVETGSSWNFNLSTDRMNAGDLDRWVGPRARPGWLSRLLSSLLGSTSPSLAASELVRQVNADGVLTIGELTIEKLKLAQVRATGSLRNLHLDIRDAEAKWAGSAVRAQISAAFAPLPSYDITAHLDGVNLSQIPPPSRFAERFAGFASGDVHLATNGVGRGDLLQNLSGGGDIHLKNVEFRGWDVIASVADGAPHTGTSRWTTGRGTFTMRNREVSVDSLELESGREQTSLQGTVNFASDADLTVQTSVANKRAGRSFGLTEAGRVLKISGPLDTPRVSVVDAVAHQPAD